LDIIGQTLSGEITDGENFCRYGKSIMGGTTKQRAQLVQYTMIYIYCISSFQLTFLILTSSRRTLKSHDTAFLYDCYLQNCYLGLSQAHGEPKLIIASINSGFFFFFFRRPFWGRSLESFFWCYYTEQF